MIKLFTLGFPRNTDELHLFELFNVHGLVSTVTNTLILLLIYCAVSLPIVYALSCRA